MSKIKIFIVFGTRPEVIKLFPLIKQLTSKFDIKICVTAQHRKMLDQMLSIFDIEPDYDLDVMQNNQTLSTLVASILPKLDELLEKEAPDYVMVQGDTSTAMAAALAAYHRKIPVGHVEAGLRTYLHYSPFPEEMNRQLIGRLATHHFSPTEVNKKNLLKEGVSESNIFVTGNTVVDALKYILKNPVFSTLAQVKPGKNKMILVTGHRRESFGEGFMKICTAIRQIALHHVDVEIIYPVHLNPNVQQPVYQYLSDLPNVRLTQPLDYISFVTLMNEAHFILTDSGGVQEEALSLGKPVLLMREATERMEGVIVGAVKIVGLDVDLIFKEATRLLSDPIYYEQMVCVDNPYGDGNASHHIARILEETYA